MQTKEKQKLFDHYYYYKVINKYLTINEMIKIFHINPTKVALKKSQYLSFFFQL